MAGSLLRPRADMVGLVEALYSQQSDMRAWLTGVAASLTGILLSDGGSIAGLVAYGDDFTEPTILDIVGMGSAADRLAGVSERLNSVPAPVFRATYFPGQPVVTHRRFCATAPPDVAQFMLAFRTQLGWHDMAAVIAHPTPGVAMVVCAAGYHELSLTRWERVILERVATHVDSAVRLRLRPELDVAAVVAPDGRICDLRDRSLVEQRRQWFSARIGAIEATRVRRRNRRFDLDPWWALFAGKYSVVPVEDRDGKRYYLLVTNSPAAEQHSRFTTGEIDVVRAAARGLTGKSIAYSLGISAATVSERLLVAATKLGLSSRHDLVRITATMFGVASTSVELSRLTQAEREVLALLRRGLSNDEIARLRQRSQNTIRNQIATMLRKTGSPSRRALSIASTESTSLR